MKVLIIGSRGFIGAHALKRFGQKEGWQAWGCDVTVDYAAKNYYSIDPSNANFHQVFKEQKFDLCINCSGAASVGDSLQRPARDFHLNTFNVFKLLDAIRLLRPACKFINLSSAAVYGNPIGLPISEDFDTHPISPYGWHKLQSELICKEYHEQFNIATTCLRIFSVFGPGLQKQLFWDLFQKTKKGSPIPLWGTGNESRDFIYIDDLIDAFECIIENGPFVGDVINVATGKETTIQEVADQFLQIINPDLEYSFSGQVKEGDPQNWRADISKLKAMGFDQKTNLEQGLRSKLVGRCLLFTQHNQSFELFVR